MQAFDRPNEVLLAEALKQLTAVQRKLDATDTEAIAVDWAQDSIAEAIAHIGNILYGG